MAIDHRAAGLAHPKGERRRTATGRRKRREGQVVSDIRPQVVARDGYCRLYWGDQATRALLWSMFGACRGPSEWSHYNATHRRSKTVRQDPERRHTMAGSLMLCRFHSQEYDQHRMQIETTTDRGCDGPIRIRRDAHVWTEPTP